MALDPLLQAVQDKVPSLQGFGREVRGGELEAYGNPVRAREAEGYIRKVTQASRGVGSYDPHLARNAYKKKNISLRHVLRTPNQCAKYHVLRTTKYHYTLPVVPTEFRPFSVGPTPTHFLFG